MLPFGALEALGGIAAREALEALGKHKIDSVVPSLRFQRTRPAPPSHRFRICRWEHVRGSRSREHFAIQTPWRARGQ
eukprot:15476198-Alexandrium_andersonii.AAC.1